MIKFCFIIILRTCVNIYSIGPFPSVVHLCDLDQGLNQLGDLMNPQLGFWLWEQRGREGGTAASHGDLVDGRQGVHQGLNLFSQFCFPKRLPTEFFLSRGKDPDCQGHRPTVTVCTRCLETSTKTVQCVCGFCYSKILSLNKMLTIVIFYLQTTVINKENTPHQHP